MGTKTGYVFILIAFVLLTITGVSGYDRDAFDGIFVIDPEDVFGVVAASGICGIIGSIILMRSK